MPSPSFLPQRRWNSTGPSDSEVAAQVVVLAIHRWSVEKDSAATCELWNLLIRQSSLIPKLLAPGICPVISHLITFRRICCCFIRVSHTFELGVGAPYLDTRIL